MDLHCAGTTAHHWFKSYSDMIIVLRLLICCELFSYLLYIVAELLWAFLNRLTCEYSAEWFIQNGNIFNKLKLLEFGFYISFTMRKELNQILE